MKMRRLPMILLRIIMLLLLSSSSTRAFLVSKSHHHHRYSRLFYHLVIVESPSKCATLEQILGSENYKVASCYGHVRNLPKRGHAIENPNLPYAVAGLNLNNYEPYYEIIPGKEGVVKELQTLAQQADKIILATDPDREGEAMAWHLMQLLGNNKNNNNNAQYYERVTFTEITKDAILHAVQNPVQLNEHLVHAQETRRVLDRLAGYTVSPLLWKKITPGLSAGRVQSVGMALTVQRERERLMFEPTEYYDLQADFGFLATLQAVNGTLIANSGSDFLPQGQKLRPEASHKRHLTKAEAEQFAKDLRNAEWKVVQLKQTRRSQNPPLPYKTSTLQQDLNRKLGISVQQTMQIAQKLYENGLITYMRTDSTTLSEEAERSIEFLVKKEYNLEAVRGGTKKKKDSKFAQEAHEAIRPAIQDNTFRSPEMLSMDELSKSAYRLIYQRAIASRMPPLVTNVTSILIEGTIGDTTVHFRASGSIILSPGYTLVLGKEESETSILPDLDEGAELVLNRVDSIDHMTQPPPRFNEASFVKELEALGVGRPSTYAGIVQILRNRAYVGSPSKGNVRASKQKAVGSAISAQRAAGGDEFTSGPRGPLVPSLTAFAVCSLLENYCSTYVDPNFTAEMEESLDRIASGERPGKIQRIEYLKRFYEGEGGLAAKVKNIEDNVDPTVSRRVQLPTLEGEEGDIGLFVGPWGPYIQNVTSGSEDEKGPTAQLPQELASSVESISYGTLKSLLLAKESGGILLGDHPQDNRAIRLKSGRFGAYLQWGDDGEEGTTTHSLPRGKAQIEFADFDGDSGEEEYESEDEARFGISLEEAIGYVSLPRVIGELHGKSIIANLGPYGPYLKYNNTFMSLQEHGEDLLTIGLDRASELVTEHIINATGKKKSGVLAEVGERDGSAVTVKKGRFGPYINWKRVNANLPVEYREDPSSLSLETALELLDAKASKTGPKGKSTTKAKSSLPPAPKRPKSAYLFFCDATRPEVAKTIKSLGEVSKELANQWSNISDADREKYETLAKQAKKEYEIEKEKWIEECNKVNGTGTKKGAASKGNSATLAKRPKNAYLYFCEENRPQVAERVSSLGDISKELARMWKETSDRSKYEEMAMQDKQRYENVKSKQSVKKVNGVTKPKNETEKASRAPSAYMLFCRDHRNSIVDDDGNKLPLGETTKRLAAMWKECDDETRSKYEFEATKAKEALIAV